MVTLVVSILLNHWTTIIIISSINIFFNARMNNEKLFHKKKKKIDLEFKKGKKELSSIRREIAYFFIDSTIPAFVIPSIVRECLFTSFHKSFQ